MAKQTIIRVEKRTETGTGPSRRFRVAGKIPAIMYGAGMDPVLLTIDRKILEQIEYGFSGLLTLTVGNETLPGVLREIQHDPVTDEPIHVDFLGVDITKEIHVSVSVVLQGTPIGVKQDSGVLSHPSRSLDIQCLPGDIPEQITVDVSELSVGQSIHVSDVVLEKGAILTSGEAVVAAVLAPTVEKVDEPEAVEGEDAEAATEDAAAEGDEPQKN